MRWIVLKFGGTSVARRGAWNLIAQRVRALRETHRVWIVASALSGVSNLLEQAVDDALRDGASEAVDEIRRAHIAVALEYGVDVGQVEGLTDLFDRLVSRLDGIRKTSEASPKLRANIMAVGELASTRLGVAILERLDLHALWVDARTLLTSRHSVRGHDHQHYLEADVRIAGPDPEAVDTVIEGAKFVLTQGFIVGDSAGDTALLGRGGSDTSAALFAALLDAERLELWSDVHGMFTADPRRVPTARLIRRLGYREARELAAMGAKVLHPRCLSPVARANIPITLHSTQAPEQTGTRIEATDEDHPAVTAVTCRNGVTLLTLSTFEMWEVPGFLARAFAIFEELEISIDLVATSQSAVSLTLDRIPGGLNGEAFGQLIERLEALGRVEVVHPCGVVSIVGRRIRAALHELGPAMEVFRERPVHLVSDSSEDLNLSFVVDDQHTSSLVTRLHERLFPAYGGDPRLGSTWELLGGSSREPDQAKSWWREQAVELCELVGDGKARYVYHLPTVSRQARRLVDELPSVGRFYYAMKANYHPEVLKTVAERGLGIECVSAAEIIHARKVLGDAVPLLFTPNFCPMEEYRIAFDLKAEVTVDGPEPLLRDPDLFRGQSIGLRIDPGQGLGHHSKVLTAGARAKFGHPTGAIEPLARAVDAAGVRVVGLHAHIGSGILEADSWAATAQTLAMHLERFPHAEWIDLGGGLGVVERPGQRDLDLSKIEQSLNTFSARWPNVRLRLEPGRFLVSEAGVLVAPVTQVRRKGDLGFVGLATGMNSLLRPALYGAWHGIHNLTRLDATPDGYWNVVGPICETSDVLGSDRLLPETHPGDVILIENAGAYGAVMASSYNCRAPAEEVIFDR